MRHIPEYLWTAKNFVAGFENLRLPITTATEGQIQGWDPKEVWGPYWESIRDYAEGNQPCRELIASVMANALEPIGTREHRAILEAWVARHIPGYRILWETDLLHELNAILAETGEHCAGFEFGKDGRGALPDRYYHLLAEKKYLVVGNHHDILGHFLLFTDPEIRRVTEKIIRVSADGHTLLEQLQSFGRAHFANNPELRRRYGRAVLEPMRPVMALMTYAWNLAQEKLYFSEPAKRGDRARFSLLGAFNTVYNTMLSSRLDIRHADTTVAGLAVVSDSSTRNIVMLPRDMRRWLRREEGAHNTPEMARLRIELENRITAYAETLETVGWKRDPDQAETTAHAARFRELVTQTLFAQWGPFRLPVGMRWRRFGRAVQSDALFSKLLNRDAMLALAEAQIDVVEIAIQYHARYFAERARVSLQRPLLSQAV